MSKYFLLSISETGGEPKTEPLNCVGTLSIGGNNYIIISRVDALEQPKIASPAFSPVKRPNNRSGVVTANSERIYLYAVEHNMSEISSALLRSEFPGIHFGLCFSQLLRKGLIARGSSAGVYRVL